MTYFQWYFQKCSFCEIEKYDFFFFCYFFLYHNSDSVATLLIYLLFFVIYLYINAHFRYESSTVFLRL